MNAPMKTVSTRGRIRQAMYTLEGRRKKGWRERERKKGVGGGEGEGEREEKELKPKCSTMC